jgi:integrase
MTATVQAITIGRKEDKPKRPRGTGRIFQRGPVWYCQYYRNGKQFRESTKTPKQKEAEKFLQKRLAEVSTGNFLGPRIEKIPVGELVSDLLLQYENGEVRGKKSIAWAKRRWTLHLKPFFGHLRTVQITTDLLSSYVAHRQKEGAENATINRELALVRRAFQRGMMATPAKVTRIPGFPRLTENNARQGFLEDAQYTKLADEAGKVGLWLRAMLAVAGNFAWRKGELLNLRVRQVDLLAREIRLEQGSTKNGEGRVVKMTEEVYGLLTACVIGKQPDDFVFTRKDGKRVKDFRKTWEKVCTAAGVPGLLFHDLRRTGARNLRRLGVSEGTAMRIGGWKTASVFRRYDIVSNDDIADAAARLDAKRKEQNTPVPEFGAKTGYSSPSTAQLQQLAVTSRTV